MSKLALDVLDRHEKKLGLLHSTLSPRRSSDYFCISTRSLTLDLMVGGGVPFGRFVVFSGLESSGKSTVLYNILLELLFNPAYRKTAILVFDFEGTLTLDYLASIARRPLSVISKLCEERVRYYEPELGDHAFRLLRSVLRAVPKIRNINGKWYEVYPKELKDKEIKQITSNLDDGQVDDQLTKKTGCLHVRIDRPYPTVVAFIDSLVSMWPEALDDSVDSGRLGPQAAMFSRYLAATKSLMAPRFATLVATNQIRERPMVMYGSPFYEPGGNAIKFYSDIRVKINTCSVPHGKGQIEVIGPNSYRYSKITSIKNKIFVPYRETYLRIWFQDAFGRSRGIDPVWDVLNYLKETRQIVRSKGQYRLKLPGFEKVRLTEDEFYRVILSPIELFVLGKLEIPNKKVAKLVEAYKKSSYLTPSQRDYIHRFSIQHACQKQILSREAFDKYVSALEEDEAYEKG